MSEVCGYHLMTEQVQDEQVTQVLQLCAKPAEVVVVDPLDGFRYPLCKRHWGKSAQRAAERLGYDVNGVED